MYLFGPTNGAIQGSLETFTYALGGNGVEVAAGEDAVDDGGILHLDIGRKAFFRSVHQYLACRMCMCVCVVRMKPVPESGGALTGHDGYSSGTAARRSSGRGSKLPQGETADAAWMQMSRLTRAFPRPRVRKLQRRVGGSLGDRVCNVWASGKGPKAHSRANALVTYCAVGYGVVL